VGGGRQWGEGNTHKEGEGGRGMFAWKPGKGITLEMYIRNIQVNKKKSLDSHKTQAIEDM